MKTILTTLPIYKAKRDQCYERSRSNESVIEPVQYAPHTPKHRLPSFMWKDDGDGCTSVTSIYLENKSTSIDITSYFVDLPELYTSVAGEDYFVYNGATLNYALPTGQYYLKITMDTGHVYYSDWVDVDCVYCHLTSGFTNSTYDTFTISGNVISSCVDAGANAYADSTPVMEVHLGQVITVITYLTSTGATLPSFSIVSASKGVISNVAAATAGLNEITLTTTAAADDAVIRIQNSGTCNFSTTEILVHTQYACGYVTLSFSNCCNVGDLLYENDFYQTIWIKSDNIEESFPYTEKGLENGDGKFIPTFRRQEKVYTIRTEIIPKFILDVLQRLKMHDVMTYIDQVGDAYNVESVDVEHEWFEGKYYATASITIDLGEAVTAAGCC
jgi:hypothetical protein